MEWLQIISRSVYSSFDAWMEQGNYVAAGQSVLNLLAMILKRLYGEKLSFKPFCIRRKCFQHGKCSGCQTSLIVHTAWVLWEKLGWKPIPLAAMQEIADPFDQQERIQKKTNGSISTLHQGGGKPGHIKMTSFGLYLIHHQPHLSIFESFCLIKSQKFEIEIVIWKGLWTQNQV